MAITERQQNILRAIIRTYIADAAPVGSKTLAEQSDFDIGPAMIRQEMATLEREGYIMQPHTSAGRIPTDAAYRWYITSLEEGMGEEERLSIRDQRKIDEGIRAHEDWHRMLNELSRAVSAVSGELSVSGLTSGDVHYVHGFSQLARDPEVSSPERIDNLFKFMDEMDRHFDRLWQGEIEDSLGVYIGKENPVKEIQSFSVITGRYSLPAASTRGSSDRQVGFVSIIGPRRMNYRKNVALVRYVTHTLENKNER